MKSIIYFSFILLFPNCVFAQDLSPCDCSDSSNYCFDGYVYDNYKTANMNVTSFVSTSLDFSDTLDIYQFCVKYTPTAGQDSIGLLNWVYHNYSGGDGCIDSAISRKQFVAYRDGCSDPVYGNKRNSNAFEFAVDSNIEYSFCVTVSLDSSCGKTQIQGIQSLLYNIQREGCAANVGSFDVQINDSLKQDSVYRIYNDDRLSITSNNDYSLPKASSSDPAGVGFLIFDCAPTFQSKSHNDPYQDHCLKSIYYDTIPEMLDSNINGFSKLLRISEYWVLPVTMDDVLRKSTGGVNNDRGIDVDGDECISYGHTYRVNYTDSNRIDTCLANAGTYTIVVKNEYGERVLIDDYEVYLALGDSIKIIYNNDGVMPNFASIDSLGIAFHLYESETQIVDPYRPWENDHFVQSIYTVSNHEVNFVNDSTVSSERYYIYPSTADDAKDYSNGGFDNYIGVDVNNDSCVAYGDLITIHFTDSILKFNTSEVQDSVYVLDYYSNCVDSFLNYSVSESFDSKNYTVCYQYDGIENDTINEFYIVRPGEYNSIGLVQMTVIDTFKCEMDRRAYLFQYKGDSSCFGDTIIPDVLKANIPLNSDFNPEFYDLEDSIYVLQIQTILSEDCDYDYACLNVYDVQNYTTNILRPEEEISIYPNPVTDLLTIDHNEPYSIQLLNTLGQIVLDRKGVGLNRYNLQGLNKGIYILNVETNTQNVSLRILTQ